MKKLLAFLLVMVLALATMTACDPADTFGDVKDTVGGWFGKGDDTNDDQNNNDQNNNDTPDTPDTPAAENYAAKAINYLNVLYGGEANTLTGSNYELKSEYTVPGTDITLTITWTSSVESVTIAPSTTAGYVTVTIPAAGDEDLNYTVTATVTDSNGNTETKTFDRVVPSTNNYMTPDEYYAASTGETVIVKGIITGIINTTNGQKYNQIYVNDESYAGGYYVYNIKEESIDDLKVGMTVKVTGVKEKTSYNEQRIKEAVIDILDETIKTVTPVDYTEIYKNAEALTDSSLVYKAGMLVTLKGVTITGQTLSNGYYHFKLGDKESYVRISSSTCCLYGDDLNTFKANHTNNSGNTADVVGVIATYDKAFYIVPVSVDAYSNFQTVSRTDAEKVQYELNDLNVTTSVKTDSEITLVTVGKMYDNVLISWASNNACAVVSTDGTKVTFALQDTEQTVILTATATLGDITETKNFVVKVSAKANYLVNKVESPVAGTAYKLYLYHGTLGQNLFLTGKFDATYNYNLGTTGDVKQSADFYLETAEGGYYLTVTVDGVKKYVNLAVDGKYLDITMDFDPITVYRFDAETKTLVSNQTTSDGASDYYFGTYSTNSKTGVTTSKTSYITGSNAANVGKTQFVIYLATISDLSAMTDADKVATEKNALTVDTTVNGDKTVDLPNATIAGVTVEWSVTDNATIADGKLVITQGAEAMTVVLTATIKAGTVTDTKTFTFEVPAKSNKVLTPMYTFEEGVAYKLVGKNSYGFFYFDGTCAYERINGKGNVLESVDVYVQFVDKAAGTFYLYFMNGTTVTYIDSYAKESSKTQAFRLVTETPEATWSIVNNAIVSSANSRAIATRENTTYYNYSNYATSNLGTEDYFTCYLAAYVEGGTTPDPTLTDAEKVAAEKNALTVDTTVNGDVKVTLPTATVEGVSVEWTVTDNATIADGKLVITQGAEAMTVVLTATIKAGDVTDTKTFTFEVPAKSASSDKVLTPVYDIKEGVAYKIVGKNANGYVYFDGTLSSGRINGATTFDGGVDVFVKFVDKEAGTFLIYFMDGTTTKYLVAYSKSSSKTSSFKIVEESEVDGYWYYGSTNEILTSIYGDRFIGTDPSSATYTTFSTYSTTNNGLTTYFAAFFGVMSGDVVVPEVTDADKVKAEADGVKFDVTSVTTDTTIALPAPKTYADDVTFTWTVEGDCATITDGKLVITLPTKSTTVTLTLVIVCGEVKDVKTFAIDVTVPVYTLNNVTAPAVDTAYKFYLVQGKLGGKTLYFAGSVNSSGYMVSTEKLAEAVDVYLEATDGGYYLYFYNAAGAKKYLDAYVNSSSKARYRELDAPSSVYTYSDEFHGLYTALTTGSYTNNYYFGTNGTYATFSPSSDFYFTGSNAGNLETTNFLCYFATLSCNHEYTSDCDTTCDICGATRTVDVEHKVDDVCDKDCNVCGAAVTPTHKYTADCDTTCDCGATRTTEVEHKVDDVCDKDCNVCGAEIVPTHKYLGECDATCEACGATRETTVDHKYLGDCDATCEICGATRETTAGHTTKACDETNCSVCGAAVEPKAHVYDGCEDTQCNNCPAEREAGKHEYSSVCDSTCNNEGCNNVREAEACVDADKSGVCDNDGCGKEVGPDTPEVEVPVNKH